MPKRILDIIHDECVDHGKVSNETGWISSACRSWWGGGGNCNVSTKPKTEIYITPPLALCKPGNLVRFVTENKTFVPSDPRNSKMPGDSCNSSFVGKRVWSYNREYNRWGIASILKITGATCGEWLVKYEADGKQGWTFSIREINFQE